MTSYEKWSLLLQGLVLVAGAVTVSVYYWQLRAMQGQLRALLETSTRTSHLDLLKLVISDADIAEVWRADVPALNSTGFKQHVFVNLHLAHVETLFELGRLAKEQVEAELKEHFSNRYYRQFWEGARAHRLSMSTGASQKARIFHSLCERVYSATAAAQQSASADPAKAAGR